MSRSRRKTPIVGHTTCGSEREDKKLWHQRWRTRERTALTSASPEALSAHLPLLENQASSVWSMGKDGRSYWPVKRRAATADRIELGTQLPDARQRPLGELFQRT